MLFNKKIDSSLKSMIDDNIYNKYRVLIKYGAIKGSIEKKVKSTRGKVLFNIQSLHCLCALVNKSGIRKIIELPEVKYICLDEITTLCSKNILHSNGIFIDNTIFSPLKDKTISGDGIGIGVIDSGVYPHINLATPSNKVIKFIDLINNLNYPYDDNGHGTFISGILCGDGKDKKTKQQGIAINSHIVMIKAFNRFGKGYVSSTLYALEKLFELRDEYNLRTICAPFQTSTFNKYILNLYDELFFKFKENNIIVVVPSGNNECTEDSITGIALSDKVITIGGLNTIGEYSISEYSCCGSTKFLKKPDFVAASDDIISLNSDTSYVSEFDGEKLYPHALTNSYTIKSGTSIACAFISGLCALLFEINPNFTFDDIYTLLKINSVMINDMKYKQGNGYINVGKLINTDFNNLKLPSNKNSKKNRHSH